MSDVAWFWSGVLIVLGSSVLIASALTRLQPDWSLRRVIVVAAAPLPIVLVVPCIWLYVDVALTHQAKCGVDSCAMALIVPIFGLMTAVILFFLNMFLAALTVRGHR